MLKISNSMENLNIVRWYSNGNIEIFRQNVSEKFAREITFFGDGWDSYRKMSDWEIIKLTRNDASKIIDRTSYVFKDDYYNNFKES